MLKNYKNISLYFGCTLVIFSPQFLYASEISVANQIVHETSVTQKENFDEVDIVKSELPFITIESWNCVHEDGQQEEQII